MLVLKRLPYDFFLLVWLLQHEKDVMQRLMAGERADMVFTDPPYGVSYADKNKYLNAISRGNCIQVPIAKDHETPEDMRQFWTGCFAVVFATMVRSPL